MTPIRGGAGRFVTSFLIIMMAASAVAGQVGTARKRVGLALGGGSARGFAHVGVLQWLEENRIPVDAIAGTSTGAFIGGLYATGLTPGEIQTMLSTTDWELLLRPDLPFAWKSFRRKEDDRDRPIRLEMGLRQGLRLQSGLNSGHQMGLWLSRLTLPYSAVDRFDDLPIPFRGVATDLGAGETVVLDRGPLGSALRASMSLPGTFDPVWRDGRLLADGGVLNNVPVDVARAMSVDVVIAVSVTPRMPTRPSDSIQGVANRSLRVMIEALDRPRLEQADVVLLPDVEGIQASDFKESLQIAARGYAAARSQAAALLPYALDAAAWEKHLQSRKERRAPQPAALAFIEVTGAREEAVPQISWPLARDLGRAAEPKVIDAHLDTVIGQGRFASAMYRRVSRGNAQGLSLDFREKSYAPPIVKFSLDVDNQRRDLSLSGGARITVMDPTSLGSEWRIDTSLGSKTGLATELLQPIWGRALMGQTPFLAPRLFYSRGGESHFDEHKLLALLTRQRLGGGLDLGWLLGRHAEVRAGYEIAQVWNRTRIGETLLAGGGERLVQARFAYEGQDRAYFPTRGVRVNSTATRWMKAPGALQPFGQVEGRVDVAWRVAPRHHATLRLEGVAEFEGAAPAFYQPGLGGAFRFGTLPTNALRGSHSVLGGLGYRLEVAKLSPLVGESLYLSGLLEIGSVFNQGSDPRWRTSATVGLAAETLLGPFFIGASFGGNGFVRAHFLIGSSVR